MRTYTHAQRLSLFFFTEFIGKFDPRPNANNLLQGKFNLASGNFPPPYIALSSFDRFVAERSREKRARTSANSTKSAGLAAASHRVARAFPRWSVYFNMRGRSWGGGCEESGRAARTDVLGTSSKFRGTSNASAGVSVSPSSRGGDRWLAIFSNKVLPTPWQ